MKIKIWAQRGRSKAKTKIRAQQGKCQKNFFLIGTGLSSIEREDLGQLPPGFRERCGHAKPDVHRWFCALGDGLRDCESAAVKWISCSPKPFSALYTAAP